MRLTRYLFPLLSAALIAACGGGGGDDPTEAVASGGASAGGGTAPTIAQVADSNGFKALLAAVAKTDLGPVLSDPNANLTVFAPTDEAFNQLATRLGFAGATAMVEALPPASLKNILSYHVLAGSKRAADLSSPPQSSQPTLYQFEGQPSAVRLQASGSTVTLTDAALTDATVKVADVAAANGVVHAIDKVLVPPGVLNIVQMAQVNPQLSSLVAAVTTADLGEALSGTGPFTVFAPTDAAFAAAPAGLSVPQLKTVLTYHVLDSRVLAADIPFGQPIHTLAQQAIVIQNGTPPAIRDTTATPAGITATDVRASNGVIHVIDKVLIPAL